MNYRTDIFKNYFFDNKCPHLIITRADQESFHDALSGILPQNRDLSILDIGCGSGRFLAYLKGQGYNNIEGADIGERQISIVRDMGIKATHIASIKSFLIGKTYDIITMIGTIEHLPKDTIWDDLKAIYDSIKIGGSFIFITPNMASFSASFRRYIDFTHEIGFSERSAAQIMLILGYKDVKVYGDYIKFKLRPKRILFYFANLILRWFIRCAYIAENGTEAPMVISKNLIVRGVK